DCSARASSVVTGAVRETGVGLASSPLRALGRRGGRQRARGGWLCMPFTATTLVPNICILALQFVFLEVHRHITLSLNLDSSQKGNVFTIMITLPRRDLRNLIPVGEAHVRELKI
ncbi:hypothetical protein HW555_007941, partial [Spodoptera exigua]